MHLCVQTEKERDMNDNQCLKNKFRGKWCIWKYFEK